MICMSEFQVADFFRTFFSLFSSLFNSLFFILYITCYFFSLIGRYTRNLSISKAEKQNLKFKKNGQRKKDTHIYVPVYIVSIYSSVYKVNVKYSGATIFSPCVPISFFAFISQLLCFHVAHCLLIVVDSLYSGIYIYRFLRFHGWICRNTIKYSISKEDFLHP